jgi:hypothetical protein
MSQAGHAIRKKGAKTFVTRCPGTAFHNDNGNIAMQHNLRQSVVGIMENVDAGGCKG